MDRGKLYTATESPKGEFGILIISTGDSFKPYRFKIRSPSLFHLQCTNFLSKNLLLADLSAIIGSEDIVFGEIDR